MSKFKIMALVRRCKLTTYEKFVLNEMIFVGKYDGTNVYDIYITQETLAANISASPRTIKNVMKKMEATGILINGRGHKYDKNIFTISTAMLKMLVDKTVDNQCIINPQGAPGAPEGGQNVSFGGAPRAPKQQNKGSVYHSMLEEGQQGEEKEADVLENEEQISKEEVVERIERLHHYGDIPTRIFGSNEELADQVVFHIRNRDKKKTRSARHAYNSAIKLIKDGRWQKPNRYKSEPVKMQEILQNFTKGMKL